MLTAVTASIETATPSLAGGTSDAANASAFIAALDAHAARHDATPKHAAKAKAQIFAEVKTVAKLAAPDKTVAHDKTATPAGDIQAAGLDATGKPLAAKKTAAETVATAKAESAATLAASLLAAVNGGVAAAAASPEAATTEIQDTAVAVKDKTSRLAQVKRDPAAPEKTKPDAVSRDAKPDPAKPVDPAAARSHDAELTIKAKPEAAAAPADAAPQASAEADAGTPATPPAGSQVTETRISLAKETAAQPGAAAPMVALRVHTKDGATRAIEIRMDPIGLGPVNVKLETDADGRIRAVLQADKAESFELLKRESGTLEAALREAGVNLGDNGLSFSLNDGSQAGADPGQRNAAYDGATARRDAQLASALPAPSIPAAPAWRDGVIDISV